MDFLSTREWKSYLPAYHFPRVLRISCSCLGLILLGGGIFTFLIAPGMIAYVVTLDEIPELEVSTGDTVQMNEYGLRLLRVESEARCLDEAGCDPTDSFLLAFSTTINSDEYTVIYTRGTEFSDPIALPLGYLMRVITVSPDTPVSEGRYTAQIQIFKPPSNK